MVSKNGFTRLITLGVLLTVATGVNAASDPHRDRHRDDDRGRTPPRSETHVDQRYSHNRSYPVRGYVAPALPQGYRSVRYRGSPYYFYRGAWYRPYGPRYVVVRPPIGIGLGFLPSYYTRVWIGGMPYYYADDTYYLWQPQRREYVVTQPPAGDQRVDSGAHSGSDEIFVYPKNGQSEEQQATDRYECHSWAVQKTGFDPTRPNGNVDDSELDSKRADYRRAEGACLEARGYSVK